MTASLAHWDAGRALESGAIGAARCAVGDDRDCLHPGLVSLPGSQSVLETHGQPIRRFLPAVEPCRRALSPDGRGGISLHLDRGSGKHAGQHFTESFGSVAPSIIGFAHVSNMRDSHAERVASAYVKARG